MTVRTIPSGFGQSLRGRLLGGIASIVGIRLLLPVLGIDQLITVGAWSKPLCLLLGGLIGIAIVIVSVFAWVRTPPKDLPSLWRLRAAISALFLGAVAMWVCVGLLGVRAQYLTRATTIVAATVIAVVPRSSGIYTCEEFVTARLDNDRSDVSFCLKTQRGQALTTGRLEAGEAVRLHIAETALGNVVRSIDPAA